MQMYMANTNTFLPCSVPLNVAKQKENVTSTVVDSCFLSTLSKVND